MKYKLYFEIYGKKMQCIIEANNENDAEYKLRGKIKVLKTEKIIEENDDMLNNIKDLFGMK